MKTWKHRWIATLTGAVLGVTAVTAGSALAQPTSSDPKVRAKYYYDDGRKNFDLGNFQKAAESFKKAYEEWPDGAFLYNVASAYRQLEDCKQALFFYKRFLSVKKDAPEDKKKEVEGHIKSLEECVKTQEEARQRTPDGTVPPDTVDGGGHDGGGPGTTGGGPTGPSGGNPPGGDRVADGGGGPSGPPDDGEEDDGEETPEAPAGQPKVINAHAGLGGAKISAGDLPIPVQFAINVGAGYPLSLGPKMVLDVGAGVGFSPVPWSGPPGTTVSGTASMTTLMAQAGLTYEVAPKIALRGELGAGVLLFGGLGEMNPFTDGMIAATGALTTPAFRVGVVGEYAVTPNLAASVTPVAFSYSAAHEGLKDDISAVTRLEFTVGLGYRM